MFVHETHNFFIMFSLKPSDKNVAGMKEKKLEKVIKAITNIGGEAVGNHADTWMLNNVMFSSSEDVYDIILNENQRLVNHDNSIPSNEKNLYIIEEGVDKVIVAEYVADNIFTK